MPDSDDDSLDTWPKPWAAIFDREDPAPGQVIIGSGRGEVYHVLTDGVRGYDGTLYVSVDIGRETDETRDRWMPLDVYIAREVADA